MLTKLRNFGKAKKGAELVEIILGVVIAVALMAVAISFIVKTINDKAGAGTANPGLKESTTSA